MKKLMTIARQFRDDENGAAMIEYTILLGIIAVAAIGSIAAIAGWMTGRWGSLAASLGVGGG